MSQFLGVARLTGTEYVTMYDVDGESVASKYKTGEHGETKLEEKRFESRGRMREWVNKEVQSA